MTAKNCGKAIAHWLHHQVFKGQHMRGPRYVNLTQREFIYGFAAQLNNLNYKKDKESMLHYHYLHAKAAGQQEAPIKARAAPHHIPTPCAPKW